jgi:hypothetical protein
VTILHYTTLHYTKDHPVSTELTLPSNVLDVNGHHFLSFALKSLCMHHFLNAVSTRPECNSSFYQARERICTILQPASGKNLQVRTMRARVQREKLLSTRSLQSCNALTDSFRAVVVRCSHRHIDMILQRPRTSHSDRNAAQQQYNIVPSSRAPQVSSSLALVRGAHTLRLTSLYAAAGSQQWKFASQQSQRLWCG